MIREILNRIYSFQIKEQLFCDLFIGIHISSLSGYQGTNTGITRNIPVIVSLHADSKDYNKLPITIYSLLNQSKKPDKLILWLDDSENLQNLPYEITQFIKNGLEIKFVKFLNNYTSTYYSIKNFPEAINVTAENCYYYRHHWLKKLYLSYASHTEDIHVHLAHQIKVKENKIISSEHWDNFVNKETASFSNILDKRGGVLYPPNCFGKDFLRDDIFLKHVPINDNLWYWTMALLYNRKIRVAKNHIKFTLTTSYLKQFKNYFLKDKNKFELCRKI